MAFLNKIIFCIVFSLILINYAYATETITLKVGESQNRKLFVYNPSNSLTDNLKIKISSTGSINSWITTTHKNNLETKVLPRENKSIPITIIATECTPSSCSGTVEFTANSTITGNSVSKKINVLVDLKNKKKFVGVAPGLSWPYLILIAVVGALITLKIQKSKINKSR